MSLASGSIDLKSLNVAGTPNKYITKITGGDGITIHDSQNQNSNYIKLTSNGMEVYKNSNMCFKASATELKGSLAEAKDIFTVGYGSAIANKTETQILNSTSGVLDLTTIPFNTNFNLTFTVFFVGYSVTLGQSTTFENKKLSPGDGFAWNSVQAGVWREAAGYSGELLPSGSMEIGIGQPTPGEKQINYNITITGTGLTFDYATITAVWEESAAVKDQVFLTFGSREDGISKGLFSSAMGLKVAAVGDYSHAEGYHTIASGNYSHASGFGTQAIGDYSYSSGYGTKATIDYQTVFGKYNLEDSEAMFIVGNGADDNNRSNLMSISDNLINIGNLTNSHLQLDYHSLQMIDTAGDAYFYISDLRDVDGYFTDKFTGDGTTTDFYYTFNAPSTTNGIRVYIDDTFISDDNYSFSQARVHFYTAPTTNAEIKVIYKPLKAAFNYYDTKAYTLGYRNPNAKVGNMSFAEGGYITASGSHSHAEGRHTIASGEASHAEGKYTNATAYCSHAEGYESTASKSWAHAEGDTTTASNYASHAEGQRTIASGDVSHAEGYRTVAAGEASHTQNWYTVATERCQTVIGRYNAATVSGSGTSADPYVYSDTGYYAFIIGNGSDNTTAGRSNALTVDWRGNVVIPNYSAYISKNLSGDERRLCYITDADNNIYGYDSYDNNEGGSYLYGNTIGIRSKGNINIGRAADNNTIYINGTTYPSANIVMPNNVSIRGKTANGSNSYPLIYATTNNNIAIGNDSWGNCYIYRVYTSDAGTSSAVPNVRITDAHRLTRTTHANSSIKMKHDIKDIENEELNPHRLYGIEVKQFIYNDDVITDKNDCRYHKEIAGFIAEQLYECYPIAVDVNEKGECEAWQAQFLVPPMLKLIQEQHEEIEQLKKEVAELKNR